jgi:ferritin
MSALSQGMIDKLAFQYKHETSNSLRYFQRATFADSIGLSGIAKFFRREAKGERGHADIVFKFANSRNICLPISGLAFDDPDFNPGTSPIVLFETAMVVEQETTALLEAMLTLANQERDYMTAQWLLDPAGLIKEQVEEENLYQSILDHIAQMKGSASLVHDVDRWILKA